LKPRDLQGNQAVEVRLARLVNTSHATTPDRFKDLQLWKGSAKVLKRRAGAFWTGFQGSTQDTGQQGRPQATAAGKMGKDSRSCPFLTE
jgi:hypothetical protein